MCIIVAKEKGVSLPSKTILKNCFDYNNDGAGLMFTNNGKVNIVKGFMTFDKFYDYLMKLDKLHNFKEKSLVMHFRISTGGNVDAGNCHPYPISSKNKDLRAKTFTTDLGMVHNGIISMYSGKDKVLNDTQMFVKQCVSVMKDLNQEFYRDYRCMNLLSDIAKSKLCFLDSEDNIYYVGDFIDDNGIKYSNSSYMSYYYYPTYNYANYDFKNYYEDDLYYEDIIIDKKGEDEKPLSEDEFWTCMDYVTVLNKGTVLRAGLLTTTTFEVPQDNQYGLDSYMNLYYIDWDNYDLITIFTDCEILEYVDKAV